MSEYWINRNCPPYRHASCERIQSTTQALPKRPGRNDYQAEQVFRGWKLIGVRSERRHTFRRNLRCWLLRRHREWLRAGAMHGEFK